MIRASAVILLLIGLWSCGKKAEAPLRIALAPAENLTGDSTLDWIAASVPLLLAAQLEGAEGASISRVSNRHDAALVNSKALLCRYSVEKSDLVLSCWREGSGDAIRSTGSLDAGLPAIVTPVGQAVVRRARAAPPISNAALMAYAEGNFLEATRLAPDFGYAYADGAAQSFLKGDRAVADRLVADGTARGSGIGDIPLGRLQLLAGAMSGKDRDQIAALRRLTSLLPNDSANWERLAQLLSGDGDLKEASAAQSRLSELEPEKQAVWNQLGYYRVWEGDLAGAAKALERYKALAPGSPNPLDSLGDVHYYAGQFKEAERYFLDSMAKDPAFFQGQGYFKAAMARLRLGDAAKATEHFEKFATAQGPAKELLLAQWGYISGSSGMADLEKAARSDSPDTAAAAWALLAVLYQSEGKDAAARDAARQALFRSRTPMARVAAQAVTFATLPSVSKEEWLARAEKLIPAPDQGPVRKRLAMYGMLLHRDCDGAESISKGRLRHLAPPDDREMRLVLAWCLAEQGDRQDAAELLKVNPVPASPLSSPFESLLIRRELDLRKLLKN